MQDSKQHTPGPWIAKASLTRWNVTTKCGERTYNICDINTDRMEQDANARLIAAAPDLLEALCDLTETFWGIDHDDNGDGLDEVPTCIVNARTAIAKARGE